MEAQAVEEGGDGGAGVLLAESRIPSERAEACSCFSALRRGVGFEVRVGGDEDTGGAHVDAGVLVVEGGDEELGGWQGDADGLAAVLAGDLDVFGFELGEVDSGDGLAVDDEEDAVAGEEVGEDGGGFGAFDDGVHGVDDGFEAAEALDLLDDSGDGGVEGGGAAGDGGGDAGHDAGGGLAEEDDDGGCSEDEAEKDEEEGPGGAAAA